MRDLPGNRVPQVGDGDGFIHPLDLVATGLLTAEEAEALAAAENSA